MLEQAFDELQRVRGVSILAYQQAADIVARQSGLELAQFVGIEFVDLDPVFAPQFPGQSVLFQASRGAVDIEVAQAVNEILGAGGADQRLQGFEGRAEEWAQCMDLGVHPLRGADTTKWK